MTLEEYNLLSPAEKAALWANFDAWTAYDAALVLFGGPAGSAGSPTPPPGQHPVQPPGQRPVPPPPGD